MFQPNFKIECAICGTVPTVVVLDHIQPQTELCGVCFFQSRLMKDWSEWNVAEEDTE